MNHVGVVSTLLDHAPVTVKGKLEQIINCCNFLEQFHLSGHFTFGPLDPVTCFGLKELSTPLDEVFDAEGKFKANENPMPPSLLVAIYVGLAYLTNNPIHLNMDGYDIKWTDATGEIDWGERIALSVELRSSTSLLYQVVFFKRDNDYVLRLAGSYDSFEERVVDNKGNEITPPKGVEKRLKDVFGRKTATDKARGLAGNNDSD